LNNTTTDPDDSTPSIQEDNLRNNLKDLNDYIQKNLLVDNKENVSASPPQKRHCRGLKVEVSVPTMDLLQRERHFKAEEDYKKLDKMRNVIRYFIRAFGGRNHSLICT